MTIKINAEGVAVDQEYYWQPMSTCPQGSKVQLLGGGGLADYGVYQGSEWEKKWYRAWAPAPKEPKWLKEGKLECQ